jgi:hypothetical protein
MCGSVKRLAEAKVKLSYMFLDNYHIYLKDWSRWLVLLAVPLICSSHQVVFSTVWYYSSGKNGWLNLIL